jgi:hypothetical protein
LTNGKNNDKKNEIVVKEGENIGVMEGEGGSVEGNKKIKIMDVIDVNKDNEDEDSDNDVKRNSCTSSYCPPCYELA